MRIESLTMHKPSLASIFKIKTIQNKFININYIGKREGGEKTESNSRCKTHKFGVSEKKLHQ